LTALGITLLIALPWQIYCLARFPEEFIAAQHLNALHFTSVLDGQGGSFFYHLDKFKILYGTGSNYLILPAFVLSYFQFKDKKTCFAMIAMVMVSYLFFSLAKTKMPSFVFINVMIVFIVLAAVGNYMIQAIGSWTGKKSLRFLIFFFALLLLIMVRFNLPDLAKRYSLEREVNHYSSGLKQNRETFLSLSMPPNTVLFNVCGTHYVEAMYYTGFPAYNVIPSREQVEKMKSLGRTCAVFQSDEPLPDYLESDSNVIIIDKKILETDLK
jgi:hypothetical protein